MDTDKNEINRYIARANYRKERCELIARYARLKGLDTDWYRVNRNLPLWERWYTGHLATGYLIRQTGVRKLPPSERKA